MMRKPLLKSVDWVETVGLDGRPDFVRTGFGRVGITSFAADFLAAFVVFFGGILSIFIGLLIFVNVFRNAGLGF